MTGDAFAPASALEKKIRAGDLAGTIAALRALDHAERKVQAARLRKIADGVRKARWDAQAKAAQWWGGVATSNQDDAARAAIFFCGGPADRAANWLWHDRLLPYLDLLAPAELQGLAAELADAHPAHFKVVQKLVLEGRSLRPESDGYIMGLIGVPQLLRGGTETVLDHIDADPGLLDGPLLRIFEVEGNAETNMSSMEKYARKEENTWSYALLRLVERGDLTRSGLLDKTLGTLEKDWPQFRAGWFSRFHARLAPEVAEMAPFAQRYLGLCHSRIAPTVTLALEALPLLLESGAVTAAEVADALAPALSSAVKGQVDAALKLLDRAVKGDRSLGLQASALALRGFAHEAADIHKKIIARLAAWGMDDAARGELEGLLPHVAAVHRDAAAKLAGRAAPAASPVAAATGFAAGEAGVADPLDLARRLAPIADPGELLQTMVYVFENENDIDAFERALEALVRMAPALSAMGERFSPAVKRALKIAGSDKGVARMLALVTLAVFGGADLPSGQASSAAEELWLRAADQARFAMQGTGLTALSAPTHMGGFIDPAVLVERVHAHQRASATSSLDEQVRALLRMAPGAAPATLKRARELEQTSFVVALRYALGDDVGPGNQQALFAAAARIRHPGADDPGLLDAYGCLGPDSVCAARYTWQVTHHQYQEFKYTRLECKVDPEPREICVRVLATERHTRPNDYESWWGRGESVLRYAATILPSNLDAFFADGVLQMGNNKDWSEARWQNKAYLALLIDRATPMSPTAIKLLALALGGKEPGQTAMAVDALVAVILEARAQPGMVAAEIAWVLVSGHGKSARYAKSLASGARAHPAMPAAVTEMIGQIVDAGAAAPPKDTGALLELMLELALANGLKLPAATLAGIARLTLSGKGRTAQKELLARFS